jgi:hypothetical protein
MKRSLILFLIFAAACSENPLSPFKPIGSIGATLDQPFNLRAGQQAILRDANLIITFESVAEDSRCPDNARCVWAGNGKLLIELRQIGGATLAASVNTYLDPRAISYLNYQVQLQNLVPYPHSPDRINPADYVATFVVTR